MISTLVIQNQKGEELTLTLEDPENGYLVTGIDGLDPVPANIVSSSFGGQDGEQFQNSYREKRNIILKLAYEPDYANTTVAALRSQLYNFFMTKSNVTLFFHLEGGGQRKISGKVEDMDAPLFTKDPYAHISILCLLPDFCNQTPVLVSATTVETTVETAFNYPGSIDTGIIFKLLLNRSLSNFTIFHRSPDNTIQEVEFAYPLLSGDILEISSLSGNKYVNLTRAGNTESVLYGLSPSSRWLSLKSGENKIRVSAVGAGIPWEFSFTGKHGGL